MRIPYIEISLNKKYYFLHTDILDMAYSFYINHLQGFVLFFSLTLVSQYMCWWYYGFKNCCVIPWIPIPLNVGESVTCASIDARVAAGTTI